MLPSLSQTCIQIQYKTQENGLNLADIKFTKLENRLFKNVCGCLKKQVAGIATVVTGLSAGDKTVRERREVECQNNLLLAQRQAGICVFDVGKFAPKQFQSAASLIKFGCRDEKRPKLYRAPFQCLTNLTKITILVNLPHSYYYIAKSNLNIFKVRVMPKIGQI